MSSGTVISVAGITGLGDNTAWLRRASFAVEPIADKIAAALSGRVQRHGIVDCRDLATAAIRVLTEDSSIERMAEGMYHRDRAGALPTLHGTERIWPRHFGDLLPQHRDPYLASARAAVAALGMTDGAAAPCPPDGRATAP